VAGLPVELRFKANTLRCVALHRLEATRTNPDLAKKEFASVQVRWATSMSAMKDLRTVLQDTLSQSLDSYDAIKAPTKEQIALKSQLDAIKKSLTPAKGEEHNPP
jgi:hypothetical protein